MSRSDTQRSVIFVFVFCFIIYFCFTDDNFYSDNVFYCVSLYDSENYQYQLPVYHSPRINSDCVFLFYTMILITYLFYYINT